MFRAEISISCLDDSQFLFIIITCWLYRRHKTTLYPLTGTEVFFFEYCVSGTSLFDYVTLEHNKRKTFYYLYFAAN